MVVLRVRMTRWAQAWVDESRRFEGLESVADAVEHMLSGSTVGKVVVQL